MYKAVCKDDTKSGICPKVNRNEYANCDAECNSGEFICRKQLLATRTRLIGNFRWRLQWGTKVLLQWLWKVLHEGITTASNSKAYENILVFLQATPAEVPDYDDNSVAPVNPNAPIVEVRQISYCG